MSAQATTAPDYNRIGLDFRQSVPRPKVKGKVIDFHCHLLAARHAPAWFAAADQYGIDAFVTMMQLEEALSLYRDWGHRLLFIAVPAWQQVVHDHVDDYLRRLEGFYNLGCRIVKFHCAPESMLRRGWTLDSPRLRPVLQEAAARKMGVMTHIGDPDTWYAGKYSDASKYGTREQHYQMWENVLNEYPQIPWVGAHMGGHPEDLAHLQGILDRHPNVSLDCSATKWIARSLSPQRSAARDFFIRNQDRILFGSDQVSGDDRNFDFYCSRFWVQRKLWETAYIGPSPILDGDCPPDAQPTLRGLALPDECLQKLYHSNAVRYLQSLALNTDWLESAR
jgi:Amidohydrolase